MQKVTRRILCGTSTLHAETMQPFQHPPAAVWDIFREVVEPWFDKTAGAAAPAGGGDALWHLYCWATSIVSAYSFELGNSRLQVILGTLLPAWMMFVALAETSKPASITQRPWHTGTELPLSTHRHASDCGYTSPAS